MARLLRMPEVAANTTEAVLQEWSVPERSSFDSGAVLLTVETEKAVVDVEAEAAGVLLKALVPGGSQVEVGAPIALLGDPGEEVTDTDALLDELGVVPGAAPLAPERRMVPDDPEGGTANTNGEDQPAGADHHRAAPARDGERIFASPLVRRLAREAGVSLDQIPGSGPRGRIVRRDLDRVLAQRRPEQGGPEQGRPEQRRPEAEPRPVSPPRTERRPAAAYAEVPHSRMRTAIATRLTQSKRETPHFYLRESVRVDKLLKLRKRLNKAQDTRVSVNDLVVKAVARALVLVPEANVIWTPEAMRRFSSVDISVAVATETGLVTPVLRGVERMPLSVLSTTIRDLVDRAKARTLRQEELEGGSFSVTNLGMFGTEEFAAVINPPQSAILAVGAARLQPVVKRGTLTTGMVMRVTLSVDHRAIDGALAARYLQTLVSVMENPLELLL